MISSSTALRSPFSAGEGYSINQNLKIKNKVTGAKISLLQLTKHIFYDKIKLIIIVARNPRRLGRPYVKFISNKAFTGIQRLSLGWGKAEKQI
jgi:hypothetical protein